jgi:phosphatidylserine/phosphatidylglycerophosphate/cardiolipin synthase-like enzyme
LVAHDLKCESFLLFPLPAVPDSLDVLCVSSIEYLVEIVKEQPIKNLITENPVIFVPGNAENPEEIETSIQSIEKLMYELSILDFHVASKGVSPGFATASTQGAWYNLFSFPEYQTLSIINIASQEHIPLPSPLVALRYLASMKDTWVQRKKWALSSQEEKEEFCLCIKGWTTSNLNILHVLGNQALEQLMVAEADACLRSQLTISEWHHCYSPQFCPGPEDMKVNYIPNNSILLLDNRKDYASQYIQAVLDARETIDICLCYIFSRDPFVKYLLLDLLPYVAKHRNVRVRLLIEQMVVEGETIKNFLIEKKKSLVTEPKAARWEGSFLNNLPPGSPLCINGKEFYRSSIELIDQVMQMNAETTNPLQIKYWFARDQRMKYRIKSHVKCHIFDSKKVIAGGSNFAPRAASFDCDFLVSGGAAKKYQQLFDDMFNAMSTFQETVVTSSCLDDTVSTDSGLTDSSFEENGTSYDSNEWTDASCSIYFQSSKPSSTGEDCILRTILGAVNNAQTSVTICMGHSNVPESFMNALAEASRRGVKVRILMNSYFSCDLRNGQRDLFISLKRLLEAAPQVELYVVTITSLRDDPEVRADPSLQNVAPDFLHSKYVVVDKKWSAIGSWNLWTRACFYEMESEIYVLSESVANNLEEKFDREKRRYSARVQNPEGCKFYCPKGCDICYQFGPFFLE